MEEILKILVVDDDDVDRMAVRRALKTAGVVMALSEAVDCKNTIAELKTLCLTAFFGLSTARPRWFIPNKRFAARQGKHSNYCANRAGR